MIDFFWMNKACTAVSSWKGTADLSWNRGLNYAHLVLFIVILVQKQRGGVSLRDITWYKIAAQDQLRVSAVSMLDSAMLQFSKRPLESCLHQDISWSRSCGANPSFTVRASQMQHFWHKLTHSWQKNKPQIDPFFQFFPPFSQIPLTPLPVTVPPPAPADAVVEALPYFPGRCVTHK